MANYRIICPHCGAVVIAAMPECVIWELCPACRNHRWDPYDVMMAEKCKPVSDYARGRGLHANNN